MNVIVDNFELFRSAWLRTVGLCLLSGAGALVLGTLIAACRVSPVPPLRWFGTGYVTMVRNCPLTVVLFFMAFGLPELGVNWSYYKFATAALIVYTAAFVCEGVRSGVNAVSIGQAEAARSIGLGFTQTLRLVVLPQALRSVVAPVGSVIIAMIKNSAIVGAFGVGGELFSAIDTLIVHRGVDSLPAFTGVALAYLAITIPVGIGLQQLERRTAVAR